MKHLNFLSKSGGQSMGLRSVTLASTVGSPSAHRRGTMLKLLSVLVLILTIGVGSAWGADQSVEFTPTNCTNWTGSSANQSQTIGGITLSSTGAANNTQLRLYSGKEHTVTSTVGKIKSVTFNCTGSGTGDNGPGKMSLKNGSAGTYSYSGKIGTWSGNASTFTLSGGQTRCTSIVVTYTPSAASHTLSSAVSPAASGSVSLSATSVAEGSTATATATPAAHYVFTSWSISGTGASLSSTTTNPTTVTMGTANATVTANFTQAPKASITLSEAGATTTDATTYYVGDQYTLPSSTEATCSGKVLVGWSTVEVAETNTKPTLNYYEKGAKVTLAATQTFYAVFATAGSPVAATLSATYSSHSGWTASDCCGSSYWILCSGASITSPVISDLSTVTSITFKARTYGGASYNTVNVKTSGNVVVGSESASNTTLTDKTINVSGLTGSGAIIFTGSATSNANGPGLNDITIHYQTVSYSKYTTSCCQPLGSINGSVSWSNGEATVSFADLADVTGWGLKYKKSGAANWSTYNSGFTIANNTRSNSTAISGLDAGSEYEFKVTGTYNGSTYCTGSFEAALSPNSSSYVPKITVTSNLTPFSYIVDNTCASQNFTVSGIGLTGNLTVNAPTNFEVSLDNSNWASSKTITVSNPPSDLNNTTVYVRLASGLAVADNYGGNISISGGSAVAISNIAITGIVSPDCSEPTINTQPSGATYNMGATAAALSVTASHNGTGPAETYQWYSNTANNNTTGKPIAGETNSTYTPSTADAGTKYYYCVVSSGACSASSNVAAIVVNTPIISVGDNKTSVAFGSKAIDSETEEIISISGTTLAKDQNITLALSGAGASAYSLNKYELEASNGTVTATNVTITYTAAAGASEATLTISSEGAASKVITLTGNGKYQATFIANGNTENILVDGEGKLVLPASDPSSCNGSYNTFIGWYSTAAGSNGAPTTDIAACGTKAVATHVLESNETYYAVWGNGALSADDVKKVTLDFTDNTNWQFPTTKTFESASYTNENDVTVTMGGVTSNGWSYNGTQYYLLFGKNGCSMTFSAFDFATSKIVVIGKGGASTSTVENIYVGDETVSTATTGSAGTNTYEIADNYQAAGTIYSLKVGSDHNAQVTKIEFYSPGAGATGFISSCCSTWDADPVVTYEAPSTWTVGDDAVSVSISGTTHGTASYVSSNPSIISVDAETGAITPVAIGSATITVTWSGDGYCDKAVTTAPVTVHGYVDVTFKKNGGSGTDDQKQSVEVGVSTALTSLATLGYGAPDCKEFGGWATTSDGEAVYDDEDPITASEATTLWAVWNTKTLSVAQGEGTAVGCEGGAFTFASSVACGGDVTITSSPDATHKAPFSITVLPADAYEKIDGNVIKNVTKPITSISVSYTEKTTYAITWKVNDAPYAPHQEEEDGKVNGDALVYEGNTITTLPTAPADNTLSCANKFMGWSKHDYKSVKKAASAYDDLFNDAAGAPEIEGATTFYAVFATSSGSGSGDYEKVTSELTNWSGDYLIVSEDMNLCFDASKASSAVDANDNGVSVTISDGVIASNATTNNYRWTIESVEGGYNIKSTKNAYYIGNTKQSSNAAGNGLTTFASNSTEDGELLTIGWSSSTPTIKASKNGDTYLVYNNTTTGQSPTTRFRFYKATTCNNGLGTTTGNYKPLSLYKKTAGMTIENYVTECAAVEAPTFSVAAGTYNEAQSVELSCATENATIRYTTDGSVPSKTSGTVYNNTAITIDQSMTLKAIAYKGDDESDVAEAAYVLQVATPTISGNTSFVNSATVTITAADGTSIYYTTNGVDPTTESTPYTAPFTVDADGTTTVKAIAVKAGWTSSEIASQAFTKITPLTVAEANTAIAALSADGTIANQYVKGLISQIDKFNDDNTITYYISDNGTTASQLQVYHGSAGVANNDNAFTAKENLQLGEEVIVSGTLKKYEKSTNNYVYEFDKPNSIVAYKTHSPIAWSAGACTAELNGEENEYPTLNDAAGLTISYESTTPATATIDANGVVTPVAVGSTTIKATSAANDNYVATTVSYTLTVSPTVTRVDLDIECNGATSGCPATTHMTKQTNLPDPLPAVAKAGYNFGGWYTDNTFETPAVAGASITENTTIYAQWLEPYTVARALEIISGLEDDKKTADNVYVAGVVTADAVSIDDNNTATYKIKDATVNNSLEVYKGKGLNNADVAAGDLQEGDQVVVYGQLMKYKGYNSTAKPEIVNPNHLYSKVRPTFDVTGVSVSPTSTNTRVGRTVELTKTIQPANASDKAVTWSSDAEGVATVDENGVVTGVAEGTAHITVTTHDGGFQATCTVTVAAGLPNFTENDHEWIKISNASKLVAGRFYVIGVGAKGVTATNDLSDGYLAKASTTITDGVIASGTLGANTAIFELGGNSTDGWTLYELTDEENTGYLSGTTSSNLAWSESATTTPISFDEDGNAVLGNGSEYRVLYNNSSPRFKPYSGAQTSMSVPQLYMWAELSHSVTFDANGGVAESVPGVERTDEGKIIIPATTPTHSDISKAFGGWYKSDAPATLYNAGDEFETNVDVTLYAKWNTVPTYTVTYVPGGQGTVPAVASYRVGQKVQVEEASLSNPGYSFAGWTVKDADQNVLPLDEENKFDMPASNVTITAVWSRISSQKWNLVKYGEALEIDAEYVIAYNSTNTKKALSSINTSGSTHYGNSVEVTIDGEVLKGSDAMKVLTLKAGNGGENYAFQSGENYLSWSSGNSLNESDELNDASSWTIEIDENNVATISNVGTSDRKLQYNTGSPRFACYTGSQKDVQLYKKAASVVINGEQTVNAADITANADVTIKNGGTLNVDADKQIGDLTVEAGGKVVLDANKLTVVGTFTIETTMASGKSGQLNGATASNFAANGPAYIDITLGAGGTNQQWHAFTVPFPVDALSGIYDLENKPLKNEVNYAIMEYLGDVRAQGKYGWKKIRTTLVPGTFYLMTVDGLRTTYRFKKTADGALVAGNSKEIFEYAKSGDGQTTDAGWNGVGNPTLMYGKVNAEVQVLDPENYVYVKKDPNSTNFVVGTPFFYQADAAGSISMLTADAGANYAPARVAANGIEKIKVSFGNEEYTDYLDISASEEAKNEYQIGKDLAKMTMTSTPKVAQIFGKAYNSKLCMVYAPMANDQAVYDLTLYAPANGEYTISAPAMENAELYLTYEGNIIWNLSMSAYPMELKKGNTEGYGLLLNAKAPMSPTGIENTDALNGANVQKVILDEKVFILRGGKMYDVTGKAVK